MRTPDDDRARARDRDTLARSTARADHGLVCVLRAIELAPGAIRKPNSNRRRLAGTHVPGANMPADRGRSGRGQ